MCTYVETKLCSETLSIRLNRLQLSMVMRATSLEEVWKLKADGRKIRFYLLELLPLRITFCACF